MCVIILQRRDGHLIISYYWLFCAKGGVPEDGTGFEAHPTGTLCPTRRRVH